MARVTEKHVKFIKPMSPYNEGQCATFNAKMADKIIEAGFADEIDLEDTLVIEEE